MLPTLLLGLIGCASPSDSALDTDPALDSDLAPACDFSAFAGDWEGLAYQDGEGYPLTFTLQPTAAEDAVIGVGAYGPDCPLTFTCTGRMQVDWHVTVETNTGTGGCADLYAFFKPEVDGSLSFEEAYTEFGERVVQGTFQRAPAR